jgi:hypothetical protein
MRSTLPRREGKEVLVSKEDYGRWMSAFRERDTGLQRSLDEVASGLASGTFSRRKALRLAGAALLGSMVAPLAPGTAEAAVPCCERSFKCGETSLISCRGGTEHCRRRCICTRSVEGPIRCGEDIACGSTPSCTSSADCREQLGAGFYCQRKSTGCCGRVCVPRCGTTTTMSAGSGRRNSG